MAGLKRLRNDKNEPISNSNSPLEFHDRLKRRCKALNISEDEIRVLRDQRVANDAWVAEEQKVVLLAQAEIAKEVHQAEGHACLQCMLTSILDVGFTLYEFLDELVNTKDHATSSQVSQMLISKGGNLLKSICQRQPKMALRYSHVRAPSLRSVCVLSRIVELPMYSKSFRSRGLCPMPRSLHLHCVSYCELSECPRPPPQVNGRIATWYIIFSCVFNLNLT